jgi:hypothetical protein
MTSSQLDADFLRKLGLKPGQRLGLARPPGGWATALRQAQGDALAPMESWPSAAEAGEADVLLIWLEPSDDLRAAFDVLERRIPPDGAIWAVIPKKSALQKGEAAVEWAAMQAAGLASGRLVDNKELRFDDRYYGTRFVVRKERR